MTIGRTRRGRLTWAVQLEDALSRGEAETAKQRLLVDALLRYGRHDQGCGSPCDCGLTEALVELGRP